MQNLFKKSLLILLLLLPLGLNAVGLGFYVPVSFEEKTSASYSVELAPNYSADTHYKESAGFGFVLDTNVQKDKVFNYRLGIELIDRTLKDVNNTSCENDCSYGTRLNVIHTFGFGIVKSENVRLWIGPRINMAFNTQSGGNYYDRTEFEIGIAPVLGLNVSLAKEVSLSLDVDYRLSNIIGYSNDSGPYSQVSYSGTTEGATARLYIIFKINDGFDTYRREYAPSLSIEDDSL